MAYVNSGYRTPYRGAAPPPTNNSNDRKPYPSPAATLGGSSLGQLYRPKEYSLKEEIFGDYTLTPDHETGSPSKPTNDIGAAIELSKDTATDSLASGSYPHQHQAEAKYAESVSTAYNYPEIMPPTMDPTKRYGNIKLGSRRPALAETGRNYY